MVSQVLITGAHGFVGRHVARHFASTGARVSGVGHGKWPDGPQPKYGLDRWHAADITQESLRLAIDAKPAVIVHCSGGSSIGRSLALPDEERARTIGSLSAVLEVMESDWPEARLVYVSSAAVYGNVERLPISERAVLRPISPYGEHKREAEELCQSYARTGNLSIAIVRLFSTYGPGLRKQLLWDACEHLCQGRMEFAGTGAELRDWLHVEDAVSLLAEAAMHAAPECPVVNGGTGKATSVRVVVEILAEALAVSGAPFFSGEKRDGDPVNYEADIEQALRWGWRPSVELAEGVAGYARWYVGEIL